MSPPIATRGRLQGLVSGRAVRGLGCATPPPPTAWLRVEAARGLAASSAP